MKSSIRVGILKHTILFLIINANFLVIFVAI